MNQQLTKTTIQSKLERAKIQVDVNYKYALDAIDGKRMDISSIQSRIIDLLRMKLNIGDDEFTLEYIDTEINKMQIEDFH